MASFSIQASLAGQSSATRAASHATWQINAPLHPGEQPCSKWMVKHLHIYTPDSPRPVWMVISLHLLGIAAAGLCVEPCSDAGTAQRQQSETNSGMSRPVACVKQVQTPSICNSICCRIDCFMDKQTAAFGQAMKAQVEERLRFYDEGIAPGKNIDAMQVDLILLYLAFTGQIRTNSPPYILIKQ